MKLMVDIQEKLYEHVKNWSGGEDEELYSVVRNGTPLSDECSEDVISRTSTVKSLCRIAEMMEEKCGEKSAAPYTMAALYIQDNKEEFPPVSFKRPVSRWAVNENTYPGPGKKNWKCINCCHGLYDFITTSISKPKWKFCPECGAVMEENNENND